MSSIFLFDKLNVNQKRDVLILFGMFLLFESTIVLFLISKFFIWFAFLIIAIVTITIAFRFYPNAPFSFIPIPDLLIYFYILIITLIINFTSTSTLISLLQAYKIRDIQVFSVALVFLLIAIIFPSFNDNRIIRSLPVEKHFRNVEKLKEIPFGYRRCISAFLFLLTFGLLSIYLIYAGNNIIVSFFTVLGYGFISAISFEYLYGYRSYIIRLLGRSLFFCVLLAILLPSSLSFLFPKTLFIILIAFWSIGFIGTGIKLWYISNRDILIPEQVYYHLLYLLTLGAGHLVVYVYWIDPLIK